MYVMRGFCSAAQVRMPGAFPQLLKRDSGSMNSVDLHHASKAAKRSTAAQASSGSVDAHHAADAMQVTSVALMSYNVGIANTEPRGKNWIRHKRKYYRLRDDIKSTFAHEKSIEILLLCEFGSMSSCCFCFFPQICSLRNKGFLPGVRNCLLARLSPDCLMTLYLMLYTLCLIPDALYHGAFVDSPPLKSARRGFYLGFLKVFCPPGSHGAFVASPPYSGARHGFYLAFLKVFSLSR